MIGGPKIAVSSNTRFSGAITAFLPILLRFFKMKLRSIGRKVFKLAMLALFAPIIVPLVIVALVVYFLNRIVIYLLVWILWLPNGKDVLYVSSDSPIWKEYMETEILPLVAQRAIVLNWSGRSRWRKWSFAVRVFRTFGGRHDFNPMIVLFHPFRSARIFRFLPEFEDWKHGDSAGVEKLRHDLIQAL
jgi:hypothetical protein